LNGRLALFVPSLEGGGAERVMVLLANGLVARGAAVDLVLAQARGPNLARLDADVRVVDLRASRVIAALPALVRYLRRERPRAMLSALSHANVVAVLARGLAGVPIRLVLSEHNDLSSACAIDRRQRLLIGLMRRTYRRADGVVAVSAGVAADLAAVLGLPRARLEVIHNPVVTPALFERSAAPLSHPWFQPDQPPVVLAVGRLNPHKNFGLLIRAFARLRARRPARLLILGEGEQRRELEALVRKYGLERDVQLPGFVDNPYPYMRRAAVFAVTSRSEGFSLVLVEAMACGVPVVSTDCPGGGPAEVLQGGRWGRLVPVDDEAALAEALARALDAPRRGEARRRALDFSVDAAVTAYLKLLAPTAAAEVRTQGVVT